MEAKIIKIGNSKGVIIPAEFLRLLELEDRVSIEVEDDKMILSAVKSAPREGWEEMIKEEIQKNGQLEMLIPEFLNDENLDDWTW